MSAKPHLIEELLAELVIVGSEQLPAADGSKMYGSTEDAYSAKPSSSARLGTFHTLSTKERKYIGDAPHDANLRPSGSALIGVAGETQRPSYTSTQVPSVPKMAVCLGVPLGTSRFLYQTPLSCFETAARAFLAALDPAEPLADFPDVRWKLFLADAHSLVEDGWVLRAEELGWTWQDIFGADDTKPFARIDKAGLALLLDGNRVAAMTGTCATILGPDRD